ncbi:MAG: cytochrome c oxidase subunit 2, partial [Ilumatobacter sp.]
MQAVETTTTLKSVTSSRLVRTLVAGSFAALLAGCATDAPQDTWQPKGSNARMINDLDWVVFSIAGVVGVVVFSVLAFALWKYRDRGQPIPEQTHGKPALEIGLTILPALILV